ncbi:MAG: DNA polymerase domain-containing protein [Thermoplasmatota archaeon]
MQSGFILDSYVDPATNSMITWLIGKGKPKKIIDGFQPSFYIYASTHHLSKIAVYLQQIPQVKQINFTKKKITLGSEKKSLVLEVIPSTIASLPTIAAMIDKWGNYHTYELFNVDIRMSTRYLQSKNVFCNAYVKWEGKQFICNEDQWALTYTTPPFTHLFFDIHQKKGIQSLTDPIESISINDITINTGNETDTILESIHLINTIDPDIIFTKKGDSFVFPYLYHRARHCKIDAVISLGREHHQKKHPSKQSKSYFSYGRIIYRPAFYTLNGRAHIDTKSSFMFAESGLQGLIDISRCSNIPLQLQSRLGPGTVISHIQVNKAMEQGFLIPWKKNMPEQCKSARQLLISDRGGLIFSPLVGIHEQVIEFDFCSLYPNIMLRFNISPETMLCKCCPHSSHRVPQLGYHICEQRKGFIPEVLKPILYRRFYFKARSKNKNYNTEVYKEIQQAWKWVLIVCFGYTGYRNARYGRIECHEAITAFARDILLKASDLAQNAGYEVLHGIIDSLWVKQKNNTISSHRLLRAISNKTGICMDMKGRYHWIVFLPSKQHTVGALTRYYGLFETGELKVRGIELRQRNTPPILKQLQNDMLELFSECYTAKEVQNCIPKCITKMIYHATRVLTDSVDPVQCMITTHVSKDITDYKVNNCTKAALLQLRDNNIAISPGQSLQYIVTNQHSDSYKDRVCIADAITKDTTIDKEYYLKQISHCTESILNPFGFRRETFDILLQKLKNREGTDASILPGIRTRQACL